MIEKKKQTNLFIADTKLVVLCSENYESAFASMKSFPIHLSKSITAERACFLCDFFPVFHFAIHNKCKGQQQHVCARTHAHGSVDESDMVEREILYRAAAVSPCVDWMINQMMKRKPTNKTNAILFVYFLRILLLHNRFRAT